MMIDYNYVLVAYLLGLFLLIGIVLLIVGIKQRKIWYQLKTRSDMLDEIESYIDRRAIDLDKREERINLLK